VRLPGERAGPAGRAGFVSRTTPTPTHTPTAQLVGDEEMKEEKKKEEKKSKFQTSNFNLPLKTNHTV